MYIFKSFAFLFLLTSQTLFSAEVDYNFIRNESTFKMIGNDFISPITEDYTKPILISSGAILATSLIFHTAIDHLEHYAKTTKPLGSSSKLGDKLGQVYPNIAYVVATGAFGYLKNDNQALYLAGVMTRATLSSSIATNILKYSVREKRPDPSTSKVSFPSGHTTTAFTFASVVGFQHGPWWGGASYLMASFVGFSRLNDNAHHLHDVLAGALIGTIYGQSICKRDEKLLTQKGEITSTTFEVMPILSDKIAGLDFEISF